MEVTSGPSHLPPRNDQQKQRSGSISSAVSLTATSSRPQTPPSTQECPVEPSVPSDAEDVDQVARNKQEFSLSKIEYTSYQDHERYIPQSERVETGTNTVPEPKRRTSVEAKKTEETQTSENDSEEETNWRVVNQIIQENMQIKTSKRTDSESSNCSTYRKSVSFDLDHDNKRPTNYYSGGSDAENDVFKGTQRKGILRSPSPFLDREQPKPLQTFVDREIERENPFRKEFFRNEEEQQQQQTKARPASVYEPESPQWSFEQIKQKMETISRSNAELRQEQEQNEFKKQIEGAKSMGNLGRGPKPPKPPKPLHIRKANLVYNEGIEDINRKMFQGDFVEFEHDARTNTIKEVQRPFSPEVQIASPTPSSTGSLDSVRMSRQRSMERPKERPPPPPPPPPKVPPPKKLHSLDYEHVHFDSLPLPMTPQYRNENSKVNILVTQEEHRRIMLQENELRNSLQSDLNLVGRDSDTESYLSSIAPEFSPVSTLQRSVSPLKVFPGIEKVPVHLRDLPSPQHPSYVRPKSQLDEDEEEGVKKLPAAGVGCKEKDTVSVEEEGSGTDDDDDDGVDIDKYLPSDHRGGTNYYQTATFSTFSGKETQV